MYFTLQIPKDWHLFLIVLLVCGMMTTVMICVALFGSYGAVKVDDNETKQVRNVRAESWDCERVSHNYELMMRVP